MAVQGMVAMAVIPDTRRAPINVAAIAISPAPSAAIPM
jgi:hypothetical protein